MVSEIICAVFTRSVEVSLKYDHFSGKFDNQTADEITLPCSKE